MLLLLLMVVVVVMLVVMLVVIVMMIMVQAQLLWQHYICDRRAVGSSFKSRSTLLTLPPAPSQILLSSVAVSSGAFLIHPRTNASPRPCQREQEEQTLKISDNLQEAEAVGVVGEAAAGGAVGVEVEVVLDMGHNPAAVAALARKLSHEYRGRKIRYVSY